MARLQQRQTEIGEAHSAVLLCGIAAMLCCFCGCVFFPQNGPYQGPSMRTTPGGVINQLILAYNNRDYALYSDLFPDSGTFQFYVSPSFVATFLTEFPNAQAEPRDTLMQYLTGSSVYYYWTQDIELQKTQNLFNNSTSIVFDNQPTVDPATFHYIIDSLGDTVEVEVLMTGGGFEVQLNGDDSPTPVDIQEQDFLLQRQPNKLWAIRKWYDLGTAP